MKTKLKRQLPQNIKLLFIVLDNVLAMTCFSLVELLLVISIIALLSSLILPALNQAKKRTRDLVCLNNLKQLGGTTTMYINDYQSLTTSWNGSKTWTQVFAENDYFKLPKDGAWLHCPSWTPEGMLDQGRLTSLGRTYGMHNRSKEDQATILKSNYPSKVDLFGDSILINPSDSQHLFQRYFYYIGGGADHKIHLRHKQKAQFLMLDGHVEAADKNMLMNWGEWGYTNTYP